jgi:HK97 family phage portal protein
MSITSLNLRYSPPVPTESDRRERDLEAARSIEHVKMTLNDWLSADSFIQPDEGLGANPTPKKLLESCEDWVYACVTAISGRVMALPYWLQLERKSKDGPVIDTVGEHVLLDLLRNPNPVTTGAELFWMLAGDLMTAGDAYWWLLPDGNGKWPTQIWRLPPDAVWVVYDGSGKLPLQYMVQMNGGSFRIDPQFVAPFTMPYGVAGNWRGSMSPLRAAARATDLSLFTQIYQGNFYKNNARPDFLVVFPEGVDVNRESLKSFKSQWDTAHKGLDGAHKWAVLTQGADIKTISMPDSDRRFIEVSEMTRDKILAAFKVPAAKIGLTTDVNRSNSESADYTFNRECINPLATLVAAAINKHIIDRFYQPANVRTARLKFVFENPVPKDEERTQKLLLDLMERGIRTPNEVAAELGYDEFDGGDQRIIKTGLIPYDQLGLNSLFGGLGGLAPADTGKAAKKKCVIDKRERYRRMKTVDVWREVNRAVRETGTVPYDAHLELFARHVKAMKPHVKPFRSALADAFDEQGQRIMAKVRANYGKSLDRIQPDKSKAARLKFIRKDLLDMNDYLDIEYEVEVFYSLNLKHLTDMFLDALGATLLELTGEQRDLLTARARRWLDTFSRRYAADVVDTTRDAIKEIIREGLFEGWSVNDAAGRIETLFDGFADWRAEMIARTELNAASNAGANEGMRTSGVVGRQQWLSALDERTRRAPQSEFDHWAANGEIAPVDGYFTATGGRLAFPGDPEGEPGNSINCRCTIVPVIEGQGE